MSAEAELEIAVLRHEVTILRRQVKRPIYRTADRAFLAAASRILRREACGAFLVRPETLLRWHRQLLKRKWTRPHRPTGRPPSASRPGRSSSAWGGRTLWGYMRIRGEVLKLGVRVSATTVATVLRRAGPGPAPQRSPTWSEFLQSQAAGILACDFLTVVTVRLKTLFVLVWIELVTRRSAWGERLPNPTRPGSPAGPEPGHGAAGGRAVPEIPDSRPGHQVRLIPRGGLRG